MLSYYPGSLQDLPLVSPLAVEASNLARQRALTLAELTIALKSDIFLSAKVVSVANSIYFNLTHTPCFTVEDALSRVGHDFALALLKNAGQISDPLAKQAAQNFWIHSTASAMIAKKLRARTELVEQTEDTVYWIAMIHDIGLLIEANFEQQNFAGVLQSLQERECLNDEHCVLAQGLAHYWSLPAWVKDLMRWHHAPEVCPDEKIVPLVGLLHVADAIVNFKEDEIEPTLRMRAGLSSADIVQVVEQREHLLAGLESATLCCGLKTAKDSER